MIMNFEKAQSNPWVISAMATLPFCAAAVFYQPTASGIDSPVGLICPFQALTDLPCPLCGATRSVVLFTHFDSRWVDYNPFWPIFLILVALTALVYAIRPFNAKWLEWARRHTLATSLSVLGVAWIIGLMHASAIVV